MYFGCAGRSLNAPFRNPVIIGSSPIFDFDINDMADLNEFSVPYEAPLLKLSVKNLKTLSTSLVKNSFLLLRQNCPHFFNAVSYCLTVAGANEAIRISNDSDGAPLRENASPILCLPVNVDGLPGGESLSCREIITN